MSSDTRIVANWGLYMRPGAACHCCLLQTLADDIGGLWVSSKTSGGLSDECEHRHALALAALKMALVTRRPALA